MNNVPVLYLWIHKRIMDENKQCYIIERNKLYYRLSELFKIPKSLCVPVLKEMTRYGMVKDHNRDCIEIQPLIMDPIENTSVIYVQAGVFK